MLCKYIKLISSENLLVMMDDCDDYEDKKYIDVHVPIVITSVRFPRGRHILETFHMEPWIKVTKQEVFRIPVRNILVITDVDESTERYYNRFIEKTSKEDETEDVLASDESEDNTTSEITVDDLIEIMDTYSEEEEHDTNPDVYH